MIIVIVCYCYYYNYYYYCYCCCCCCCCCYYCYYYHYYNFGNNESCILYRHCEFIIIFIYHLYLYFNFFNPYFISWLFQMGWHPWWSHGARSPQEALVIDCCSSEAQCSGVWCAHSGRDIDDIKVFDQVSYPCSIILEETWQLWLFEMSWTTYCSWHI